MYKEEKVKWHTICGVSYLTSIYKMLSFKPSHFSFFCIKFSTMGRNFVAFVFISVFLLGGFSSVSASKPPAKIVSGIVTNAVSALVKWLWSLKAPAETGRAISSGSRMKFEGGYTVETSFDGSKFGIDPYSVEVSPSGELLVLDSENSNIHKISTPLSKYSRPRLVAGSPEGYYGHVDGKPKEARMNHPKGLTVDDRGNIYIADTMNMAIRKISDTGVTTIAGGKRGRGGGHVDGPSEDAKFSDEFDLVYIGSTCSLLVVDRGNQAIREIQLHHDDCSYRYDGSYNLGIFMLVAAAFFGYMLALLQRRVQTMFSSQNDSRNSLKRDPPVAPYQRPRTFASTPLIPTENDIDESGDGFFVSIGRLLLNTGSSVAEMLGGLLSGLRRKPTHYQYQHQYQQKNTQPNIPSNGWPMQESFIVPDEDKPPSIETRSPTLNNYPYMTKDLERKQCTKQMRAYCNGWDGDYHHHQQQQQIQNQQQHHHRNFSPNPQTYREKSCETNEIVFGAVQEQDGRREAVVIKAVDYGNPTYSHHNIRTRPNYRGYSHGYS